MRAVSQIIERNLPRREACDNGLWINPEQDGCWQQATECCPSLSLFCQDHGSFRYLQGSGAEVEFGAFPGDDRGKYQWIILNLPRQKALLGMLLDCAAPLLDGNGTLWLAGENRAGIKSAAKHLKSRFSQVSKLDSARHCTLFAASGANSTAAFDPAAYREEWPLVTSASDLTVVSYPGVFAHGRLDQGTALLLDVMEGMHLEGEVLDFACGTGVIGASIARHHPHTQITLLDNNALALLACEGTLRLNGLQGILLASDGLSELDGNFDLVVSNPPIHAGVKTDTEMSMRLLDALQEHLRPKGRLIMVANIHLPYEKWLAQRFRRCRQLASNERFKVIGAER